MSEYRVVQNVAFENSPGITGGFQNARGGEGNE